MYIQFYLFSDFNKTMAWPTIDNALWQKLAKNRSKKHKTIEIIKSFIIDWTWTVYQKRLNCFKNVIKILIIFLKQGLLGLLSWPILKKNLSNINCLWQYELNWEMNLYNHAVRAVIRYIQLRQIHLQSPKFVQNFWR